MCDEHDFDIIEMMRLAKIASSFDHLYDLKLQDVDSSDKEKIDRALEDQLDMISEILEVANNHMESKGKVDDIAGTLILPFRMMLQYALGLSAVVSALSASHGGKTENDETKNPFFNCYLAIEKTIKELGGHYFRLLGLFDIYDTRLKVDAIKVRYHVAAIKDRSHKFDGKLAREMDEISEMMAKGIHDISDIKDLSPADIREIEKKAQELEKEGHMKVDFSNYISHMSDTEWRDYSGYGKLYDIASKDKTAWNMTTSFDDDVIGHMKALKGMIEHICGEKDNPNTKLSHTGRAALKVYPYFDSILD